MTGHRDRLSSPSRRHRTGSAAAGRVTRRRTGPGAGAIPLAAILAGGLTGLADAGRLRAQELRTISYSRQVTDEEFIEVEVQYGIGDLTVRGGAPGLLYRARMRFHEQLATPTAVYEDGRLEFGIEPVEEMESEGLSELPSMHLELPSTVPMDLTLFFLGGTADVDLSGMPIRALDLTNGASESTVSVSEVNPERMTSAKINVGVADFTANGLGNLNASEVEVVAGLGVVTLGLDGEWPSDSHLSIGLGLGAMRIEIPASLAVRVQRDSGFFSSFVAARFEKDGDTYTSDNWEDAGRRLEIDLSATLGSVEFIWLP